MPGYDETLYRQFKDAIWHLEAIPVEDWPGAEPARREQIEVHRVYPQGME